MEESDVPELYLPPQPALPDTGLLIDVGRQRQKHVNRLKRGEGRLTREVQAALYNAREELGIDPATEIVPVVLLYHCTESDYALIGPTSPMPARSAHPR